MSIFTPSIYNEPSFSGLFRLLDDFDNYRASTSSSVGQHHNNTNTNNANQQQQRQLAAGRGGSGGGVGLLGQQMSFAPKFDLRETDTAFELRGDLPGVDRSQVHVEFADENTLTVRGRVEREWNSSSSNNNNNDASKKSADEAVGKAGEEKQDDGNSTAAAAASKDGGSVQQQQQQQKPQPQTQTQAKYWITERSVGEFSRSFRLTGHPHHHQGAEGDIVEIDHDGVTARLDNGVLSVVVPKVVREKERPAARKVQIN